MSNIRLWIIIGIIVSLLAGFMIGVIIDRAVILKHRHMHKGFFAQEIFQEKLLARLSRKLDLTRPQIQAIGGILRLQALKIKETREIFRANLKGIKEETQEKIMLHLTPEQQERYKKLVLTHKKRWEKLCD